MGKTASSLLVYSGLLLSTTALASTEASATTEQTSDNTMVVTASKQSASAASSRNVASGKVDDTTLSEANVTRTDQLNKVFPGLRTGNSGSLIFQSVSLRGISSAQDFYTPAVSFYVDGVPQLSTFTMQALTDVESVELLSGPQGTLYGKSAQGGIINIVTHQPDSTAQGYVDVGIASRDGYDSKLSLSGPLKNGLLYGGMTLLRQVDNGSFTNPATGSNDLGGSRSNAGSAKLRLAPDDQPWETTLALSSECSKASQDTYLPFSDVKGRTLVVASGGGDPYLIRCTRSESLSNQYDTNNWRFSLISAWQQQSYNRVFPYSVVVAEIPEQWNQNVQEMRAATLGQHQVDMVFGLYRQAVGEHLDSRYLYLGSPMSSVTSNTEQETQAAYTDLTWHITSRFDLGGGIRFSHDQSRTDYNGSASGSSYAASGTVSDNQWLGQLSAGYQLTPAWRLYSRVAQGYKPKTYSIVPAASTSATPVDAEQSINYEAGVHYQQGDLQLQSALFRTHTKNMQLYSGSLGYQSLSNAGTADATGVEMSSRWQFIPRWNLNLQGNYVQSEFADDSQLYSNNKVPFVPHFTAASSVDGQIDTHWGAVMPRLALNLVGPQYFDGDNALRQGAYVTTDFNLGWQVSDRVRLSAYADNLLDRRYRTYAFLSGSTAYAQMNEGRTVGMNVHVDLF